MMAVGISSAIIRKMLGQYSLTAIRMGDLLRSAVPLSAVDSDR
jgi:hypothetical protein